MKATRPSFLIDVSRLVGRLMRERLPTGIDRVALAYVRQYGCQSRAFVRDSRFHVVLPERFSQALFHLLLQPPPDFKSRVWRLIAQGAAVGIRPRDLSGTVFFNIAHSGLEYHRYPDMLRRMDVRPVFMVHDLIPITHPEYCRPGELEKHRTRMLAVLELARGIITNSRATQDALAAFADAHEARMPLSTPAFPAPHDFGPVTKKRPTDRLYFVVLGTVEPRKNHLLLLNVWKRLAESMGDQAPLLVVIGQRGWECENVVDMLERCGPLRDHILELSTCSDAELATWLHHAQALLFPSFAEGFGLPLVEALACGTPVIASDLAVFRETAHTVPDYLDPLNGIGWLEMIADYTAPASQVRDRQLKRMATFMAPTWEGHFRQVDAMLEQAVGR